MSIRPADDPSFRVGTEQNDALSVMTRLRASQAFESNEPSELDGAVDELIDKNLDRERPDWSETTRKVMRGIVESISDQEDADWAIRRASHRAVLAVARRWGNIVMAGKATVVATQEAACRAGFDSVKAAQQAGLGAIEGVLQVGPVAYCVLQREISPIVEDFMGVVAEERRSGEWMLRSLERSGIELPVIEQQEVEVSSLDLSEEDYRCSDVIQAQVLVSDFEDNEEELPPPPSMPVSGPQKTGPGLVQRLINWVKGLLGRGRDKKPGR
ncbi:hypothetical protein IV102_30290 [bacterium]|nr:hypothetical protein [bacterium]